MAAFQELLQEPFALRNAAGPIPPGQKFSLRREISSIACAKDSR
jgi:hypothetical protein